MRGTQKERSLGLASAWQACHSIVNDEVPLLSRSIAHRMVIEGEFEEKRQDTFLCILVQWTGAKLDVPRGEWICSQRNVFGIGDSHRYRLYRLQIVGQRGMSR